MRGAAGSDYGHATLCVRMHAIVAGADMVAHDVS